VLRRLAVVGYVCTGNAKGRALSPVAYPRSPSLIALDKRTGRLLAKDDEKIGTRRYEGSGPHRP
jgi:hypothetical protein